MNHFINHSSNFPPYNQNLPSINFQSCNFSQPQNKLTDGKTNFGFYSKNNIDVKINNYLCLGQQYFYCFYLNYCFCSHCDYERISHVVYCLFIDLVKGYLSSFRIDCFLNSSRISTNIFDRNSNRLFQVLIFFIFFTLYFFDIFLLLFILRSNYCCKAFLNTRNPKKPRQRPPCRFSAGTLKWSRFLMVF